MLHNLNNEFQNGGFSGSGASGNDQNSVRHGAFHRLVLCSCKSDAELFFESFYFTVDIKQGQNINISDDI